VWDPLLRILHWSLTAAVLIAFVSDENRSVHEPAGYVVLGLVLYRLIWRVVGSRYSRFSEFVVRPSAIMSYLDDLVNLRAPLFGPQSGRLEP